MQRIKKLRHTAVKQRGTAPPCGHGVEAEVRCRDAPQAGQERAGHSHACRCTSDAEADCAVRESEGLSVKRRSCLPVVMRCVLLLVCCASLVQARAERRAGPDATEKTLTIHLANAPIWFGDLDAMIERRAIRVLTVNDRMLFFVDKGVQRGVVVDAFRIYEKELNARLSREGRLDDKNLPVRVVFIPVHHDALLTGLTSGLGDIAAANLTVTASRRDTVDFARAGLRDVTEWQ